MDFEQREALREAAKQRAIACRRCGATHLYVRDGAEIGGMPGIKYKVCGSCGNEQPITKRPRRRERLD